MSGKPDATVTPPPAGPAAPADHAAPTDCCAADPRIARHFDQRARKRTAGGRLPEMVNVTRTLLGLLDDVGAEQPTLLELGCGTGALTVELLGQGATSADGFDLSAGAIDVARRRAEEAGVAERVHFALADAAQAELTAHDWVVLDRVICCYPDVDRLLGNAVPAAHRRLAFSVPARRGWRGLISRLVVSAENATNRLRRYPCPGYVHDIDQIERRLADAGFRRLRHATVGLWYAAVFERPADA